MKGTQKIENWNWLQTISEPNHSLDALPNITSDHYRFAILRDTSRTETDFLHSAINRAGNLFVRKWIVFAYSFLLEESLIVLYKCRVREPRCKLVKSFKQVGKRFLYFYAECSMESIN